MRGEVIARIVNPDELEIRRFVPLRHVKAIQPGHVVDVTADCREFTVTVSSIVPVGDPRTQSFEVLVKAPAVDGLLAAGNTVQVRLPLGESLRGREKLDVVGVLEGETRRVTLERVKPPA